MHKLLEEKLGLSNIRIRNANRINNSGKKNLPKNYRIQDIVIQLKVFILKKISKLKVSDTMLINRLMITRNFILKM